MKGFQPSSNSHHGDGNYYDRTGEATRVRERAITERAPAIVRHLYEQDLIGIEAAARLSYFKITHNST